MTKYILNCALFFIFMFNFLWSEEITPFNLSLGEDQLIDLLDDGYLMGRMDDSPFPVNLPFHSLTENLIGRFPIDVYGDILMIKERNDQLSNKEYLLQALNIFLSTSDQKGIQYNSDSKGLITLIKDSYAITEKGKKIENRQFEELPLNEDLFVYQNDYYFAGNKFRYHIETVEDGIHIKTTNLNTMRVRGIFKAIDKEKLDMDFFILTDGEYVCIYGIALVDNLVNPIEAFGLKVDIPSAMSKRMKSVIDWFFQTMSKTI